MTITKDSPSPSASPSATPSGKPSPAPSATPSGKPSAGENDAAQQFLPSVTPAATDGLVYMGGGVKYTVPPGSSPQGRKNIQEQTRKENQPRWLTLDAATNDYFNWTQKQRDDFRAKGLLSGLLTQGAGDLEAFSLWQNLVKQASMYGKQNQQVGPLDILSGYVKGNSNGGWIKQAGNMEYNPATGQTRYAGPQFKTTTQTQVDLSDPATARAIATKVFQDLLGRDPGQGDISSYAAALAQSEQQNPSSTTTTTQYDMTTGDPTSSSSVTQGGMTDDGRALLASDAIKQKKEYGATQAATTYMNALQAAVGGGG